jgi:hypothetical protein
MYSVCAIVAGCYRSFLLAPSSQACSAAVVCLPCSRFCWYLLLGVLGSRGKVELHSIKPRRCWVSTSSTATQRPLQQAQKHWWCMLLLCLDIAGCCANPLGSTRRPSLLQVAGAGHGAAWAPPVWLLSAGVFGRPGGGGGPAPSSTKVVDVHQLRAMQQPLQHVSWW